MKKEIADDYPFTIRHLSKNDGGGYLIEFPDLPGCMSDGETIDEAIENGRDAVICWISAAKEIGRDIPQPGELDQQSGKWVQRVTKSMHLRLVEKAEEEGVSLNTLVITIIAQALGENNSPSYVKPRRKSVNPRRKDVRSRSKSTEKKPVKKRKKTNIQLQKKIA